MNIHPKHFHTIPWLLFLLLALLLLCVSLGGVNYAMPHPSWKMRLEIYKLALITRTCRHGDLIR
jgi:hypothetical protein